MISDTAGWRRHKKRIKISTTSIVGKKCPKQQFRGHCKLWFRECKARETIIEELRVKNAEKAAKKAEGADVEEEDEKKDEPTIERLVQERVRRRCPYSHDFGKAGRKNVKKAEDAALSNLLVAFLNERVHEIPREVLEEEADSESDAESEAAEGEGDDMPPPTLTINVRTETSVDVSQLRPMLAHYNEKLSQEAAEANPAMAAFIPQLVDFNNVGFLHLLFTAIQATGPIPTTVFARGNDLVEGEQFIGMLKKHAVAATLRSLDLSENKLESLRLLYHIKSECPKLVNLGLQWNPITRKPDYREQIRRTLVHVIRLDGEVVRNPPLALPHPTAIPTTREEYHEIAMDVLTTYFAGIEAFQLDEDFAMKYLHPSATLSLTILPDTQLYDLSRYADDVGCDLLSGQDKKEIQLFQVSLQNASRDLRLGRIAVHRLARGPLNVMNHYLSTIYPERFIVDHHLGHCQMSVDVLPMKPKSDPQAEARARQKKIEALGGRKRTRSGSKIDKKEPVEELPQEEKPQLNLFQAQASEKPTLLVTLHGAMSWRTPTMRAADGIRVSYDRVMTLVASAASGEYQIQNDCLTMRNLQPTGALFCPYTEHRVARMATVFGLDTSDAGITLVKSCVERTNSDKALFDALSELTGDNAVEDVPKVELEPATLNRRQSSAALGQELIVRHNTSTKLC